jgi:predicted kinase
MTFVAIFIGIPGAGKSTLINKVAAATGASVVCRDRVRDAMFQPCSYTAEEKQAAYHVVLASLQVNAQLGRSSLVDGMCFTSAAQVEEVRELATSLRVAFWAFHCACPVEVAIRRVEADRASGRHLAADRDAMLVGTVASSLEPPPPDAVALDTSRPPLENLPIVLDALL